MKRSSITQAKAHEDVSDCLSGIAQNSNQIYLEDSGSPYLSTNNGHLSDSDGLSESSRKIRKKRNTYQKISDDIRVLLLEAVQNGETLKAAAKRHKINYSSAKSILHTYRKEGRILKKSAQERTTKKKIEDVSEPEVPKKAVKSSKKENVQPTSSKTSQDVTLSGDKAKNQLHNPSNNSGNESMPLACIQGPNDNSSNPLKVAKYENHLVGHPTESQVTQVETNHTGPHGEAHGHVQKTKLFDNFHMNYFDAPLAEVGADHALVEGHKYTNYMFPHREFDPFHEMMSSMQGRHFHMDGIHNQNTFLYPKSFNFSNGHEDKTMKVEHMTNYEDSAENPHCPLQNFMDSENLFRQALRKASFFSYGGNSTGYRKDSMDLF